MENYIRFTFYSHLYIQKKIVFTLFALYVFLLVLFVSIISTVIFVGKVRNSTSIYSSTNYYFTIRREACTIAISQVLVQASLDHQNYVKYVPTVFFLLCMYGLNK